MATLSEKQVDRIYDLLLDQGVNYQALQIDLLDHVCCMIEAKMDSGLDFGQSLTLSTQEFGLSNFLEIQEATLFLFRENIDGFSQNIKIERKG